jgi:hypothetical protein
MLFAGENQMQESEQEDTVHKNVSKTIKLLRLELTLFSLEPLFSGKGVN